MRKIITFALIILLVLTGTPAAFGKKHANLNRVYDLQVKKIDETTGDHPATGIKSAVLELRWKADVGMREDIIGKIKADTIEIYRTSSSLDDFPSGPLSSGTKIGEVNVEKDKYLPERAHQEKTSVITFTDRVSYDKKYQYAVAYGELTRGMWDKSDIIPVMSKETYEEKKGEAFQDSLKEYERNASWIERLFAKVIIAIPNFLIDVIGMEDPVELIFDVELDDSKKSQVIVEGNTNKINQDDKYLHTFSKEQFSAIAKYYERLSEFVPVSMVAVVVLLGLGLLFTSANPNSRLTFKEYVIGLLLAALLLKAGIYVISVIFDINYAIVKFFRYAVSDKLSSSFLDTLIMADSVTLGSAIVTCLAVFSVGILNWQYAVRQIILALLIGILPLMAVFSIIPSRRMALSYWFREFFTQVFLQASHAAVLSIGILVLAETNSFWIKLGCIMGLPVIASLIRRIFDTEGAGSGAAGTIGSALGARALLNVSKMIKPQKSIKDSQEYTDKGTSDTVIKAASPAKNIAGNVAAKTIRAAGAASAGITTGMVASTLSGHPSTGVIGAVSGGQTTSGIIDRIGEIGRGGKQLFFGGEQEKIESTGANDLMQLEDPVQAYKGAKNALGGGMVGAAAGSVYALGKSAKAIRGHKSGMNTAKEIARSTKETEQKIPYARQKVDDYKPVYEAAKARYERAKGLYSENSDYMKQLKAKKEKYAPKYEKAGEDFLNYANNHWNKHYAKRYESGDRSSDVMRAKEIYDNKKKKLDAYRKGMTALENKIDAGKQEFKEAERDYHEKYTEYNHRQYEFNKLQARITREGIRKEFEKARQQNIGINGGIDNEISWR